MMFRVVNSGITLFEEVHDKYVEPCADAVPKTTLSVHMAKAVVTDGNHLPCDITNWINDKRKLEYRSQGI